MLFAGEMVCKNVLQNLKICEILENAVKKKKIFKSSKYTTFYIPSS